MSRHESYDTSEKAYNAKSEFPWNIVPSAPNTLAIDTHVVRHLLLCYPRCLPNVSTGSMSPLRIVLTANLCLLQLAIQQDRDCRCQ